MKRRNIFAYFPNFNRWTSLLQALTKESIIGTCLFKEVIEVCDNKINQNKTKSAVKWKCRNSFSGLATKKRFHWNTARINTNRTISQNVNQYLFFSIIAVLIFPVFSLIFPYAFIRTGWKWHEWHCKTYTLKGKGVEKQFSQVAHHLWLA